MTVSGVTPPPETGLSLCVLASGSSGNCSVLVSRPDETGPRRVVLLDAGLSPRRTQRLLAERGIRPDEVDDILFTHLDTDHCHSGWTSAFRPGGWRARLRIHRRHLGRAERAGLLFRHTEVFEDTLDLGAGLDAKALLMSHDDLGVAVFRLRADTPAGEAHLGFATDLGHTTDELIASLRGVDALAIESNYCPVMQHESDRPAFLKQRITGGAGHLSNTESARAARQIGPRERLVLLHLSRQCNTPDQALRDHAGCGCEVHVTDQFRPTPWFTIRGGAPRCVEPVRPRAPRTLFDFVSEPSSRTVAP